MKRIKLQFTILCFIFVQFDLASARSLKQLWNKLRYDNQRLDYYQPYSSFNYLPTSSINYPASLNNLNLINNPIAESSNLHRTIVSLPENNGRNLQNSIQNANLPSNNIQNGLQSNNVPNMMTAESINNQNYAVTMPQQLSPAIQHFTPEFLYDFNQKSNGYSMDSLRNLNNLNGLQSINSGLSLTSLTPLLLLSSLGTLSSKSLAHSSGPLTPTVSTGFLKGLTTYLSSYLPSSPRQRKRQIDRNLPPALNSNHYSSFKKMTPFEAYPFPPHTLQSLASQPKTSISAFDASFKKYSHFNKKKPIKYTKPKWVADKMINDKIKKNKNQFKYSKLMNETGFVNRMKNVTKINDRFSNGNQFKFSEIDKFSNEKNLNKPIESKELNQKSTQILSSKEESTSRSGDEKDTQNDKDKHNENKLNIEHLNEKLNEDINQHNGDQLNIQRDSTESSNQPQADNLDDIAEKMYSS